MADQIAPTGKTPSQPAAQPTKRPFSRRLLRALFDIIIIILLLGGIAALVRYGVPWVSENLIEPVRDNTRQVTVLDSQIENLESSVGETLDGLEGRLTTLETGSDAQREQMAAFEDDIAGLSLALDEAATDREALAGEVEELWTANQQLAEENQALAEENATLAGALSELEKSLADLAGETTEANAAQQAQLTQINAQLALLRIQNTLLTAEIELLNENRGLARQLATAATADLRTLVTGLDSISDQTRRVLLNSLEDAEAQIDEQPDTALSDLNDIWEQLDRTLNRSARNTRNNTDNNSNSDGNDTDGD